jgi:hypothetical protein
MQRTVKEKDWLIVVRTCEGRVAFPFRAESAEEFRGKKLSPL